MLDRLLAAAPDWLVSGGLFGVISFHSLEDRRIKTAFVGDERLQRVTRKPETAAEAELSSNPRSRSAKWRVARRR
jgi:16S rRNA (cytosine1402-N4)-methyltransferase